MKFSGDIRAQISEISDPRPSVDGPCQIWKSRFCPTYHDLTETVSWCFSLDKWTKRCLQVPTKSHRTKESNRKRFYWCDSPKTAVGRPDEPQNSTYGGGRLKVWDPKFLKFVFAILQTKSTLSIEWFWFLFVSLQLYVLLSCGRVFARYHHIWGCSGHQKCHKGSKISRNPRFGGYSGPASYVQFFKNLDFPMSL